MLNVQGLIGKSYDKLNSYEVKQIFKHNDIILFTETWTNEEQCLQVEGFTHYPLHRKLKLKNARRDSGGLLIYISNRLVNEEIIFKTVDDCIIWLKLNGNLFGLNDPLLLCLCYNVPSNSSREVFVQQNIFDLISDDIFYFENMFNTMCNFVIMGDMNSRVGSHLDYVENEYLINLNMLPDDYVADVPLKRTSQDKILNENGNYLLNFCKATGMRILNGRIGEDKGVGKFTCITHNGCSVVDYVLCRTDLINNFSSFTVENPNILSDHYAISFVFGQELCILNEPHEEFDNVQYCYKSIG